MVKSLVARGMARFRQLCCLGLESEVVIPALLAELHTLVPSLANTFYFTDAKGETSHIYLENTEFYPLLPIYWELVHERSELSVKGNSFSEAKGIFGAHTRQNAVIADRAAIMRTDFYNLTERVVGYDPNFLRLIVRHGGRMLGGVRMWRAFGHGDWSDIEMRRLETLGPFFAHALTAHGAGEMPFVDSREQGLIVASTVGKVIYFTTEGKRLLFLATHPRNGPGTAFRPLEVLPPPLARLCTNLRHVFADETVSEAPTYSCRNAWGEFSFRAQWLEGTDAAAGLVAITATQREPRRLRLARNVQQLALTARQADVCVLLAEGLSIDAIAGRLGISRHTVNEHSRWIYNNLDVHSRAELTGRLLAPAGLDA